MDEKGVEGRGSAPLKPVLNRIAALKDKALSRKKSLTCMVSEHRHSSRPGVLADQKDTTGTCSGQIRAVSDYRTVTITSKRMRSPKRREKPIAGTSHGCSNLSENRRT